MSPRPICRGPVARGVRARLRGLMSAVLLFVLLGPLSAVAASHAERLAHADEIKRKDFPAFTAELDALEGEPGLAPAEREYLAYLQAWRMIYTLEYDLALQRLDALIGTAGEPAIRQRAAASRVNVLTLARRHEEAFSGLNTLLEQLPSMRDPLAREQLYGVASMLLIEVGEFDQALQYAVRMREERASPWGSCAGAMLTLDALSGQKTLRAADSRIESTIRDCERAGEMLPAGLARSLRASLLLQEGRAENLLPRLQAEFGQVRTFAYPRLVSEYEALLATANLQLGRLAEARTHANAALEGGRGQIAKPQVDALHLLYRIERAAGNLPAAIDWLERHHEARQQLLNETSVRQLAYQRVRSEAVANRLQIEALNRQNQLLAVEQELKEASLANIRLWLALALLVLIAVSFGAWRFWRSQRHFRLRAERDGLTGIANRAHFLTRAEQELRQAERAGQSVALIVIDLDHFKAINDSWGHAVGDQVLKQAAAVWSAELGASVCFARLGGEEFAVLLTGVDAAMAQARAEALRQALTRQQVDLGDRVIGMTASFGVACSSTRPYGLRQLLIRADAAMYQAKQGGRDRVVVAAT